MAIDEKTSGRTDRSSGATDSAEESSAAGAAGAVDAVSGSGSAAPTARPRYIQTWPLTTADFADDSTSDARDGSRAGGESAGESTPERLLVVPETVQRWPLALQRQWIAQQRRRLQVSANPPSLMGRLLSPAGTLLLSALVIVALLGAGVGALVRGGASGSPSSASSASSNSSSSTGSMGGASSSASTANVPDATQQYGNQPAQFVMDPDGAKHFTLTAQQVMWQPVTGQKTLAWTLDGTVPGPAIHVTAGDHVRITIVNHLPEATAIHWHGLEVPTDNDGVPPIGMKPIQPGQSYTYDFTVQDQDAGTHWYHSHYDDLTQVGGGMYGAFLVDPRPGSPEATQMQSMLSAQVDQLMFVGMLGNYYVINGKSFPDTQPILVQHGQTVHIRLFGADVMSIHPMHLHGHSFQIVAEDGHMLSAPITKDTVQVAPGETYDLTFYAGAAPGSVYPFHCHILTHLMNPGQTSGEMGGLITLVKYAQ